MARQLRVLKTRIALDKYEREEVTLMWAADFAGVSFSEMAKAAAARGIPYFRYSVAELEADVKTSARWLR
jgi:predicted HTH domain antitoxin